MTLTLHYHPLSSYCHKVLIALYEKEIAFERNIVNFGDPDSRARFFKLWPMGKMPVLEDGATGEAVTESSIIIEYLDGLGQDRPQLVPADPGAALQVRRWDRFFDLHIHLHMQNVVADRIKPEERRDPVAVHELKAKLAAAYAIADDHMRGRVWAAGESFGLADCAASPALFYAGVIAPFAKEHRHLAAYFERLISRPSIARVLEEAKPFFQYYPFRDDLPERFR